MNELSATETEDLENLQRVTVTCRACQLPFDYVIQKTGGTKPPKREYCKKPMCPGPRYTKHNQRAKRTNSTRLAFGYDALNKTSRASKRVRKIHAANDRARLESV